MRRYPEDAWERAMKIQEVILRAMAKRITWWQAAEIIGMSDRSERRFGTWQGRLSQELRLAGIRTVEEANRFLRERYIPEMNRKFSRPAAERGHAFVPVRGQDLDRIFSVQHERVVANDNTVRLGERVWQLERTRWRGTLAR